MSEVKEITEPRSCNEHGEYTALGMENPLGGVLWMICPTCAAENTRARIKEEEAEDRKKLAEFCESSGIGKKYWGVTLEGFNPMPNQNRPIKLLNRFVEVFEQMEREGKVIILCGGVGTGKTRAVCALMQTLGFGEYIRSIDISRRVRSTYSGSNNGTEESVIKSIARQRLLIIDEVGVQSDKEHERNLISDIIDRRYSDLKPTVICSNLEERELEVLFGQRAWDRLNENCVICPMIGESLRKKTDIG